MDLSISNKFHLKVFEFTMTLHVVCGQQCSILPFYIIYLELYQSINNSSHNSQHVISIPIYCFLLSPHHFLSECHIKFIGCLRLFLLHLSIPCYSQYFSGVAGTVKGQ